jgi:uncharacterized protein
VPARFSQTLAKQLRTVGSPVELYTYPRTDHNLSQSFGAAMRRSVAFFDKHVK